MYAQNVRPAKRRPRRSVAEQQHQDQQLGPGLVELRRVQRDAERRADVGGGQRVGEVTAHGTSVGLAVAAAGGEAAEPAGDVAERDARREHIAGRPERQAVSGDVPEGHADREDQAAVEHAARPGQRQQVGRRAAELVEVDDQQQQLRADQRAR